MGIVLQSAVKGGRNITYKLYGYSTERLLQGYARTATATDGDPLIKPVWTTGFSFVGMIFIPSLQAFPLPAGGPGELMYYPHGVRL